jgi:hypothetical protein
MAQADTGSVGEAGMRVLAVCCIGAAGPAAVDTAEPAALGAVETAAAAADAAVVVAETTGGPAALADHLGYTLHLMEHSDMCSAELVGMQARVGSHNMSAAAAAQVFAAQIAEVLNPVLVLALRSHTWAAV